MKKKQNKQSNQSKKVDDFDTIENFQAAQAANSLDTFSQICKDFWISYSKDTPKKIKLIDWFCVCCFFLAFVEFAYMFLIRSSFPFNSFLASIFTPIGTAIITICFRLQINPETKYLNISFERAVWEYLFAILTLFLATVLFVG